MRRRVCGGCGAGNLQLVLDLGSSPLADEFAPTQREAIDLPAYPLQLLACGGCKLVQLSEVVDDAVLWGGEYGFYTGSSNVAVRHFEAYARSMRSLYPRLLGGTVVEIACNDGVLLNAMRRDGALGQFYGIDPAAGPVDIARKTGLDVTHAAFGLAVAVDFVNEHGPANLVIANNVIAHVADLDDFVAGLAVLLDTHGTAVVEFQYLIDLIAGNQFDHVYHEHRQFFCLTALDAVVGRHGLIVLDVEQTDAQGGSLRVHMGKVGFPSHAVRTMLGREFRWLRAFDAFGGLQLRAERMRDRLRDHIITAKRNGLHVAGYGASAKSATLLNFCGLTHESIEYFVDTTPAKIGRFAPGSGIPIISPSADSRAPDIYLLTVWNYAAAIMARERDFAARGGKWLVPIPVPVLI